MPGLDPARTGSIKPREQCHQPQPYDPQQRGSIQGKCASYVRKIRRPDGRLFLFRYIGNFDLFAVEAAMNSAAVMAALIGVL
jgi:hypothetical protein